MRRREGLGEGLLAGGPVGLRHVSRVPVPLAQRHTKGWAALGAPSRRPSRGVG